MPSGEFQREPILPGSSPFHELQGEQEARATPEHREHAESIAFEECHKDSEAIAAKFMQLLHEEKPQKLNFDIPCNDIRGFTLRFRHCLTMTEKFDAYPCAILEDGLVPVDILQGITFLSFCELLDQQSGHLKGEVKDLDDIGKVNFVSNDEAEKTFFLRLVSFISGRLGNHAQDNPPTARCGMGVHLTVDTDTKGLEIHSAPGCFLTWTHFGSPTSPVDDCIPASSYHFKAIQWDPVARRYVKRYQTTAARYVGGAQTRIRLPV